MNRDETAKWGKHECPVCGKTVFRCRDSYDICDECDWIDNSFQAEHPDEGGLDNLLSVNEARRQYAKHGTALPFDLWESQIRHYSRWEERLKNLDSVPEWARKKIPSLFSDS